MKLYLISNNLQLSSIKYANNSDLDLIRMVRPLTIDGENLAKNLILNKDLLNVASIYSSLYSSAISTAKYIASYLNLPVNLNEKLNECVVGKLGSKNMKMVKGLQDHEFTYKLAGGESLVDVGNRLDNFVKKVIEKEEDAMLFTHKRAILGLLLKYSKVGYNLDENLILTFNDEVIYDDSEEYMDIYELEIDNKKIVNIARINERKDDLDGGKNTSTY